jgi:hypothetical protein
MQGEWVTGEPAPWRARGLLWGWLARGYQDDGGIADGHSCGMGFLGKERCSEKEIRVKRFLLRLWLNEKSLSHPNTAGACSFM